MYGTSSLKYCPDVADPNRLPLFWSGFTLWSWLKSPKIKSIFEISVVGNFTNCEGRQKRVFPQNHTKLLNKKCQLDICAPPPNSKSPPWGTQALHSLFLNLQGPLSLFLSYAGQIIFLAGGGQGWGVDDKHLFPCHRSKMEMTLRAKFILEIVCIAV